MDVFIARQPIFDINKNVYGYEILYREGQNNCFPSVDGEIATSSVITRCFIDFGISDLTNNKKAFINFTGELLKNNIATIFPKEYLVIEILESVKIDSSIIEACRELKRQGYTIAIDDFKFQTGYEELIKIVDIIKVDFMLSSKKERKEIVSKYKREGLAFLAEKVETYEDYKSAIKMGYTYFQGYYFSKPEITSKKKIIPGRESYIKLINALNDENPDFKKLALIIERDLAFSYEILRLVNNAYYYRGSRIKSISHALVTLGIDELKKWVYLTIIRDFKQDKPEEIINICIIRGRFMRNIALIAQRNDCASEMMTIGMFSMIDLLMDKSMEEALEEINFSDTIKTVLTNKITEGFISDSYKIALKYERGEWDGIGALAGNIGIPIEKLNNAYIDAIRSL